MIKEIDNYYFSKEEPNKSCLLALRKIILAQDPLITETQKWNMPCFCYRKWIVCYIRVDKKTNKPYMLMVEGKYLTHSQLEAGDRSKMKIFRVDPNKDLPLKTIQAILRSALNVYETGLKK